MKPHVHVCTVYEQYLLNYKQTILTYLLNRNINIIFTDTSLFLSWKYYQNKYEDLFM